MFQIKIAIKNYSPHQNIKNQVANNKLVAQYW